MTIRILEEKQIILTFRRGQEQNMLKVQHKIFCLNIKKNNCQMLKKKKKKEVRIVLYIAVKSK